MFEIKCINVGITLLSFICCFFSYLFLIERKSGGTENTTKLPTPALNWLNYKLQSGFSIKRHCLLLHHVPKKFWHQQKTRKVVKCSHLDISRAEQVDWYQVILPWLGVNKKANRRLNEETSPSKTTEPQDWITFNREPLCELRKCAFAHILCFRHGQVTQNQTQRWK